MSSRNYTLANARKKITLGQQYDATDVLLVQPSLLENQMTTFFNPNTCGPSGNPRCDLIFANSDEYNLNELYLEFTMNNLGAFVQRKNDERACVGGVHASVVFNDKQR